MLESFFTTIRLWKWNSVPKRRNIKFRLQSITQKKAYNIQNTAKVWNQENLYMFRTSPGPSSGVTSVFMRRLVLVIVYGWQSRMHNSQSDIQNNMYQVRMNTVVPPDDGPGDVQNT
jgi:hypothetical protein